MFLALLLVACHVDENGTDGSPTDVDTDTDTDVDPALEEGFEVDLTRLGGCTDVVVYAVNEADTVMLTVVFDHPLAGAGYVDTTSERDLPDPSVAVEVVVGTNVSDLTCDDAASGNTVVVERWKGGEGHVTLSLDIDEAVPPGADPTADVTLSDIRLRPTNTTDDLMLPAFAWTDISVGWLPGR
jgi:hypothetical protein